MYALLHNAGRSVSADGSIALATIQHADHVQIVVRDNGTGIAEAALPHIFERFYREDRAHSTDGFGLGLAIAQQIVNLHEGKIVAQSQAGEGATFIVDLPVR